MCVGNPYSVAMSSRQPRKRRKVTASNNGSIKPFWVVVGGLVVAGARVPVVARPRPWKSKKSGGSSAEYEIEPVVSRKVADYR